MNHLLLPMVQGWLRSTARRFRGWHSFATNFKQCCGLATDLVVFYHKHTPGEYSVRQCRSLVIWRSSPTNTLS